MTLSFLLNLSPGITLTWNHSTHTVTLECNSSTTSKRQLVVAPGGLAAYSCCSTKCSELLLQAGRDTAAGAPGWEQVVACACSTGCSGILGYDLLRGQAVLWESEDGQLQLGPGQCLLFGMTGGKSSSAQPGRVDKDFKCYDDSPFERLSTMPLRAKSIRPPRSPQDGRPQV